MINKEVSRIIQSRHSVYPLDFNGCEIEDDIVLQILKNANHAPTHRLTQPWLFKIFSKSSKMKLLSEITKLNGDFTLEKKAQLEYNFNQTSHIICVCMHRNLQDIVPEWEEIAATAMSVQNIWISCVDSNIGGYWSTPKYVDQLNNFLSLKKNERCLGLFYLGVHDSKPKRNVRRKDIDEKIEWFR